MATLNVTSQSGQIIPHLLDAISCEPNPWPLSTIPLPYAVDPDTLTQFLRPASVSLLFLGFPFLLNYMVFSIYFQVSHYSAKTRVKVPSTIPYWIPFLGSSLQLGFNALKFIDQCTQTARKTPFGVAIPRTKFYFVQGAENIVSLWKQSATMTGTPLHLFCQKNLFGMPPKALEMYAQDNSGPNALPFPDSHVSPHNRVDHHTHVGLLKLTNGTGLTGFYERWATGFLKRIQSLEIGDDWIEMPDFMMFFDENFGSALVESVCGPALTRLNPEFNSDFAEYDRAMPGLLKGLPRWMIPQAYRVRDKLIFSIRRWHAFAREQSLNSSVDRDSDPDPHWGSTFIRERQGPKGIFEGIDNFDEDARAASDLGFLWASNTNLVPSAMWATLETFKDTALLTRVRAELDAVFDSTSILTASFSVQFLQTLPLLQSIYAETLRLYVRAYIARYTDRASLLLQKWLFPKKSIIMVSTYPAHMDNDFWNTQDGVHPVDEFWADRFLIHPGDPRSGPQKMTAHEPTECVTPDASASPKFSLAVTNGSWFPYGGGPRVCVGRAISKRCMMAACAIMASMFDVEILAEKTALEMDPKFYGLGGQRPIGDVRFRIRKRKM